MHVAQTEETIVTVGSGVVVGVIVVAEAEDVNRVGWTSKRIFVILPTKSILFVFNAFFIIYLFVLFGIPDTELHLGPSIAWWLRTFPLASAGRYVIFRSSREFEVAI